MKIEDQRTKRVPIEEVKAGECFLHENKLHVKVYPGPYDIGDDGFPNIILDLERNSLNGLGNGVYVVVVPAKIVVQNKED